MSEPLQKAGLPPEAPHSRGGWVEGAMASLLCLAALVLVAQTFGQANAAPAPRPLPPVGATALVPPTPVEEPTPAALEPPLVRVTTEGSIGRGETLAESLDEQGVPATVVHVIADAMSPVFNFRYSRPGDSFVLTQDASGEVVEFQYTRSALETYSLRRQEGELLAERHEPELLRRQARIAGVVTSSLYEAVSDLGEAPELAHDFAEIFAWDVDFSRSVQPGDEFSMLYDRMYLEGDDAPETYVGPGRILAARYFNAEGDYTALYFEPEAGSGGYYRPDGSSVQRQFLKAPLNYRRISSRYTASRLHPILKVRRPHFGIDYAAARGTPVWAVADGKVIFRGYEGGFGNLVKVRHNNGYVSYYGHLSRFPKGLAIGQKVRQKQIVGFVGSTGLSTGPHLDFRLKQHGRYVNPAALDTPAGQPIGGPQMPLFSAARDALLGELDPARLVVMSQEAL